MSVKKHYVIHACTIYKKYDGHRWIQEIEERNVELMAKAGNYAMVRRKGAMPYVAPLKEIREKP